MAFNLRNRNFVKLLDFTPAEIKFLLKLSTDLKSAKYGGYEQPRLTGKNIALIFEKSSTRTRTSFEVAAYDQGANVTYLGRCWVGPTTASSTGASPRQLSRPWPNMPACPYGTA